ncbi:hypothetical protein M8C21_000670 [Ambrosia artemisiifolia]|uniref:Uncharacterized protein n=1 Tax=Ambrosia artemisiifolia TaxID=4212 RepID=A0AAD5GUE1_AMBAR|nr:hypothetical protein M8C21_000670 [Ambrosia artemisiifolia]
MDRISHLPEPILHRILCCLNTLDGPPAERVRMSVLSKTWFRLTASYPFLDFKIDNFTSRESFFKYVEHIVNRCLVRYLLQPAELDIVNRCLELVLQKGVRVLMINIINLSDVPESASVSVSPITKYRLPNILLSVSVLKSLTIFHCDLPSSFMLDALRFKSLIKLGLAYVRIDDDEGIKYLTTSCPLLQQFHVIGCSGFKRFCVHGHQNLQNVWIYNTPVEIIDIEAPNLSDLFVAEEGETGQPQMNLASCKKLTKVTYHGNPLANTNAFTDFLSNFPFVENLSLVTSSKCNNLKLSSHSLRTLVLYSPYDLEDIEFNTPNLVLFVYTCNPRLRNPLAGKQWSPVRDSTHLKACMQCYTDEFIDAIWFQKLRLFLDKNNGFKISNLYIHAICSQKLTELDTLKAIELLPYELEHVELHLDTHEESLAHIGFVDAVLWCCRPRSLTLRSSFSFEEQSDVVKFTYEKLLKQEDQGHTYTQIVWPSSPEAQKLSRNLKSLSMPLPREGKTVSFIKEEVIQEAS